MQREAAESELQLMLPKLTAVREAAQREGGLEVMCAFFGILPSEEEMKSLAFKVCVCDAVCSCVQEGGTRCIVGSEFVDVTDQLQHEVEDCDAC